MKEQIDWQALASQLGMLREGGESSGTHRACEALEILLGEDNLRHAVDYYISGKPGSELARSVLWHIRPFSAMRYCYDVFKSDLPVEARRLAVELLRVVADKRAVGWIDEFLNDDDAEIQAWGAGVLDQLLWSYLVKPEEVEHLLLKAENHSNVGVQERAEFIRGFLKDRLDENEEVRDETNT
jgi:hypothetical protein